MSRLYLRNLTAGTSPTAGEKSTTLPVGTNSQANSGAGFENLYLGKNKGTTQTSKALNSFAQTGQQSGYVCRFSSDTLAAQTFNSAVTYTIATAWTEQNAAANTFMRVVLYVWRPGNSSVVGFLYDGTADLLTEFATTEEGRVGTFATANSVTSQAGDILVLEMWYVATQSMGTAYTNTLFFDGTTDPVNVTATSDAASYVDTGTHTVSWEPIAVSITETAAALEATDGPKTTLASVAESAAAADTPDRSLLIAVSIGETAAAAEAPSATLTLAALASETAAAADTTSNTLVTIGAMAESAAASDTPSTTLLTLAAIAESAAASDAPSATQARAATVAETAAASDAVTGLAAYSVAVAEQAAASDALTGDIVVANSVPLKLDGSGYFKQFLTTGPFPDFIGIINGGTGATTASGARASLGLTIGTDVQAYDPTLQAIAGQLPGADNYLYFTATDTASVGTITSFGRSLVDDIDASAARTTLGLVIGTNVQPYDADLGQIAGFAGTGLAVRTAADTWAQRSIAVTSTARLTVTNPAGVAGDPTLDLATLADGGTGTFLKITRDTYGRVSGTTAVVQADITGLGIPSGSGSSTGTNTGDQNIFQTVAIATDVGYSWGTLDTNSNQTADTTTDTLTLVSGAGIDLYASTVAGTDAIKIEHTDTSTLTGAQGSAGIASITVDGYGHVTAVSTASYVTQGAYTAAQLTMNTARLLGRTTAAAGAAEEISVGSNLTLSAGTLDHTDTSTLTGAQGTAGIASITVDGLGHVTAVTTATYLTGNQSITLSGDVSGTGTTAITTAIGANKVTLAMMAQVVTNSLLGRATAGTGNVEVLTTIPSAILGNSTLYVGTTAIALNRGSASQALTGITSIDGSAATLTTTRTIWGQNFNGSANVVGAMSGNTSIQFDAGASRGIQFAYGTVAETYSAQTTLIGNNVYVDATDTVSDQIRYKNTHGSYGHTALFMAAGNFTFFGQSANVTAGAIVSKVTLATLNASGVFNAVGGVQVNGSNVITAATIGSQTVTNATNVYQDNEPATTTYRLLLGNTSDNYGAVYNFNNLYYNHATATIQGANVSGTASNITAYTINQSVGTGNAPSFSGLSVPSGTVLFQGYSSGDNWLPYSDGKFYIRADTRFNNVVWHEGGNWKLRTEGSFQQGTQLARPKAMWGASGTTYGCVIIYLPGTTSNYGMLHIEIDTYEYDGDAATTYFIGGHNWSTAWYNYSVRSVGPSTKAVRLGVKNGQFCIVIGGQGVSWEYGQVVVRKAQNGTYYDGTIDLGGTWSIVQDNGAESFTSITSNACVYTLDQNNSPYAYNMNQYVRTSDSPSFSGQFISGDATTRYGPNSSYSKYLYVGGNGRQSASHAGIYTSNGNLHIDPADGTYIYLGYYSNTPVYIGPSAYTVIHTGNIGGQTTAAISGSGNSTFGTLVPYGVGGNSGQADVSYGIYQQAGAWGSPFPDLCIAMHTGIKIGAYTGYGGTRFYSNSDWVTELFSVGNSDDNVRVAYSLLIGGYMLTPDSAANFKLKGSGAGAQGITGYDSGNNWKYQLYGDGTNYGFLNGNWAGWDMQKGINGEMYVTVSSVSRTVIHTGNIGSYTSASSYTLLLTGLGTSTVNVNEGNTKVYRNENGLGAVLAYAPVAHFGGGDTMWQLQGTYGASGDGTLYFRQGYSGSWGNWLTVMTNANQPYAWALNQTLTTSGTPTFAQVYSNDWFRSNGNNGWYNQTHAVGIYATGAGLVQTYNSAAFQVNGYLMVTGQVYGYDAGVHFRARYTAGSDIYHASLNWYGLQLGNNGGNYIVAGRTNVGGTLHIYVNNTSDFTTINGTLACQWNTSGHTQIVQALTMKSGAYLYPGRSDVGDYQTSWYLYSNATWGLQTNTSFNAAALYDNGNRVYSASTYGAPTTAATASTIAYRDASGDLTTRYFLGSYINTSDDTSSATVTYIMAKFGDNYHRSADATKVKTFLDVGTNGKGARTISTSAPSGGSSGDVWYRY